MTEEIRDGRTVTLTTDELADLAAQAAQEAVKSKGLSNAAAYAAVRAIGNVTNVTETLGLPLPENNETVAYQDFINSANLIIDNFAKTTGNTLDSVSATASAAANGVSAADTKIANITTRLDNDQVDSLPQFKQDTEDRLERVENDVMGLSGWSEPFKTVNGDVSHNILVSSIGVFMANRHAVPPNAWEAVTETLKGFITNQPTSGLTFKSEYGFAEGNIFNLPTINEYYIYSYYYTKSDGTLKSGGVGVKWTGVQTVFAVLGTEDANSYFSANFFPMVRK